MAMKIKKKKMPNKKKPLFKNKITQMMNEFEKGRR
jgi:hypothetical protein